MFDIGWVEMLVIVVVMVVIIGPKDLPRVLHGLGQWVSKARAMARQFQDSIEVMARDTGIDEVRDQVRNIRDFRMDEEIERTIDPDGELRGGIAGDSGRTNEIVAPQPSQPENRDAPEHPAVGTATPGRKSQAARKGRSVRANAGRTRAQSPLAPTGRPRGGPGR